MYVVEYKGASCWILQHLANHTRSQRIFIGGNNNTYNWSKGVDMSATQDESATQRNIRCTHTWRTYPIYFQMASRKVDARLRLVKNQREMKKKIESPLAKYPFLNLGFPGG